MTPRTRGILKDALLQLFVLVAGGIVAAMLSIPMLAVLFLVVLFSLAIWYFPRRRS
jgi:hypothetical protein